MKYIIVKYNTGKGVIQWQRGKALVGTSGNSIMDHKMLLLKNQASVDSSGNDVGGFMEKQELNHK